MTGASPQPRVFFALWPDGAAASQLAALAQSLTRGAGGRPTPPASLHLTLAFVGAVTPAQVAELQRVAATVRADAFELCLDRLGFWPQRGILWAGGGQLAPPLGTLFEQLAAALRAGGFRIAPPAGAAPVPHVTLARGSRGCPLPRLEPPVCWRAAEFALVESRLAPAGACYKSLARFPLVARDAAAV